MDKTLLDHPLVPPTAALRATAPVTEAEAARLLTLDRPRTGWRSPAS